MSLILDGSNGITFPNGAPRCINSSVFYFFITVHKPGRYENMVI